MEKKKKKLLVAKSEKMRTQLKTSYPTLDKEVRKSARVEKKTYIEMMAEETEPEALKQNIKPL